MRCARFVWAKASTARPSMFWATPSRSACWCPFCSRCSRMCLHASNRCFRFPRPPIRCAPMLVTSSKSSAWAAFSKSSAWASITSFVPAARPIGRSSPCSSARWAAPFSTRFSSWAWAWASSAARGRPCAASASAALPWCGTSRRPLACRCACAASILR